MFGIVCEKNSTFLKSTNSTWLPKIRVHPDGVVSLSDSTDDGTAVLITLASMSSPPSYPHSSAVVHTRRAEHWAAFDDGCGWHRWRP